MAHATLTLAERRSRLEAARDALEGIDAVLHQATGVELALAVELFDDVAARAGAARAMGTAEAVRRGEVTGGAVHEWVREHAPSLRQGGAGQLATVASRVADAGAALGREAVVDDALGIVWRAVTSADLDSGTAAAMLRELGRLAPLLRDEALPAVAAGLVDLAQRWGPALMRRLRPQLLAQYGHHGVLGDLRDRLVTAARLSSPLVESADLIEYQLLMTPDQAAVLEAAIGPLSAPAPNPVTGEADLRPAGQRRVEALAAVCEPSSVLDAEGVAGDRPAGSPAALRVTMSLTDLERRTGSGEVLGSVATGALLSPEAVRRITCDAALVPHVLGTAGEDLDLGRVARLFTRAQRRRLWRRDRGCTHPRSGAPAAWSRAHHVVHWADGGETDVGNAALLCQRHHGVVHRRRLVAEVLTTRDAHGRFVVWDLAEGSYDRVLVSRRTDAPGDAPPGSSPSRAGVSAARVAGRMPAGPPASTSRRSRALGCSAGSGPRGAPRHM